MTYRIQRRQEEFPKWSDFDLGAKLFIIAFFGAPLAVFLLVMMAINKHSWAPSRDIDVEYREMRANQAQQAFEAANTERWNQVRAEIDRRDAR